MSLGEMFGVFSHPRHSHSSRQTQAAQPRHRAGRQIQVRFATRKQTGGLAAGFQGQMSRRRPIMVLCARDIDPIYRRRIFCCPEPARMAGGGSSGGLLK
jgi:hypothetical protein